MGLNIGLSLLWVDGMGFAGLALANSTATSLEAVILFLLARRKVGGLEDRILAASVMRTVAASACMGVVLYAMGLRIDQSASGGGFWVGLAALGLAFVTYAGVSAVLRHPELNQVQSLARRGRR
jgi:putative peptidoglycan lipid II flippase